jgi:hypothetical protein
MEPHQCEEYQRRKESEQGLEQPQEYYKGMANQSKDRGIPCRVCGAPITFSEDQRSPYTGKMIPLELGGERHRHRRTVSSPPPSSTSSAGQPEGRPNDEQIWGSERDVEF